MTDQEKIIAFLKKHPLLKISGIESNVGMPAGDLYKAIKGQRGIPEHYTPLLNELLKQYGYRP